MKHVITMTVTPRMWMNFQVDNPCLAILQTSTSTITLMTSQYNKM